MPAACPWTQGLLRSVGYRRLRELRAQLPGAPQLHPILGRPLGHVVFSLIGFERIMFRSISQGFKGHLSIEQSERPLCTRSREAPREAKPRKRPRHRRKGPRKAHGTFGESADTEASVAATW